GDGRRLLTATDVTAVHVLQTELRELRQLGQRDGTTAEVAHGLGNVFGIIQMACETILDASLAEQVRAKVNDMREAGLRGTALTGRLLGHVFEDEPAVPSTELIGVLRTTTKLIGRILPADVTLDVTLPETEHYVAIGHGPLEAALIKLLSVARRAVVGSGGTIRVTAKATGDRVEIEMSEDRSGASTAETVAYSDRTQALGTHDDSVAEVGNLLDGVGGQLTERSLSKGGRLFRLSLPYTSSAGEADGAASMRSDARLAGYRILLAESDGPLRSLLTEALRQMGGVVAVVDSGARAIECLTEDRVPDIVISNRSFTDGTTLADLAARARRSPGKAPRFVILSAVPDPSDAELEGAVHLRKPVNLSALAEAIFSSPPGAGRSDTTGDQGTSQASDA
ncbi:MAG: response regulator, partial [Pseudomonadota bacterium]